MVRLALLLTLTVSGFAQMTIPVRPSIGEVVRLDGRLDRLIDPNARIEVVASGFEWAEGPVWVSAGNYLLFSDIPRNSVMKWSETEGITLFLKPSRIHRHGGLRARAWQQRDDTR